MDLSLLVLFILVYLGMMLGNWPGLALDRTGIALLGAIAFIMIKNLSVQEAIEDIDVPSLAILFSFMIVSGQLYYSGFYTYVVRWVDRQEISPRKFLMVIILTAGVLSALLINDIVCLAMTPLVIKGCFQKKFNPVPFLIALACASNIGSALTLIGNPQNMLIGQVMNLPFGKYFLDAFIPCILGWGITWLVIQRHYKDNWFHESEKMPEDKQEILPWQCIKGIVLIVLLVGAFFLFNIPREHLSLAAAGILLLSRRMASSMMLSFIDWQLLVLFIGLFIVNHEFNQTGMMQSFLKVLHIDLSQPQILFPVSTVLSNLISNVPAVMLLLPFADSYLNGVILALSSTLAGNMFIIGSIANIIVIAQAAKFKIPITWKEHAKSGIPITLLSLLVTACWLYLI